MIITKCGKQQSNTGKLFTEQSVKEHELHCVNCLSIKWREAGLDINGRVKQRRARHPWLEEYDEPDGALLAMMREGYF